MDPGERILLLFACFSARDPDLRRSPGADGALESFGVVEVLGPDYARRYDEVYIDNDVLEGERVDDKDEILRQGETEKEKHRADLAQRP